MQLDGGKYASIHEIRRIYVSNSKYLAIYYVMNVA